MKTTIAIVIAGVLACGGLAQGGAIEAHRTFLPQDMKWEAAPSDHACWRACASAGSARCP